MTSEIYELIFRGLKAKYPGQAIGPRFQAVCAALDGGEGSGNFGHEGRPGQVGGSGEGGADKYKQAFERVLKSVSTQVRQKMKAVKIDFQKDNILPEMNREDADYLGIKPLPFRLSKSVIERQKNKHPLTDAKARILLACALYNPDFIGGERKDGRFNFISYLTEERNPLVLVDVKNSPDGYYDIVHYYFLDAKRNKKKRTEKEGRDKPI